jgi:GTP cyclohydrolase I
MWNKKEELLYEECGDNHFSSELCTPIVNEYLQQQDSHKIHKIQYHFSEIMRTLGLDLEDDSLKGTPYRVAKMYVKELFSGLLMENKPDLSIFDNTYQYNKLLIEKDIELHSACEHHFLPIIGKCHVAYVSSGNVIGLSKMNRIVQYFSKRPQVQERLTLQICKELQRVLKTDDVIVIIEAKHLCVSMRGVKDSSSTTITMEYGGCFEQEASRNECLKLIQSS